MFLSKERRLPTYVRFADLRNAGIARNWQTLQRLIDDESFPAGQLLSANTRAWRLDEVEAWLDGRPTQRKETPDPWPESRRKAVEERRQAARARRVASGAAAEKHI